LPAKDNDRIVSQLQHFPAWKLLIKWSICMLPLGKRYSGANPIGYMEETSSLGAHSIAVDSQTHTVWITFVKNDKPYVQTFTAK
jgi:hypothetical protein